MQRILLTIAVLLILAGLGAGAYFVFFANQPGLTVEDPGGDTTLPVGGTSTTTVPGGDDTPVVELPQPEQVAPRLVQISKGPVAGGEVAIAASSTNPTEGVAVRFIARENGNVYEYLVRSRALTRISNKTIPGIQEALWRPDGSLVYLRYLTGAGGSTINTYALPARGEGGYFLAQNIRDLAMGATSILSVASASNGSSGSVSKPDGSNAKVVFSSPLSSLRANFAGSQYLAYSKPSAKLMGYAFLVNSTGLFERIAGPLPGLTALASPSGKWALVASGGETMQLSLINLVTKEVTALPIATMADKCVWSLDERAAYCGVPVSPPPGSYPDDWYQGAVHLSDRIWKIDVNGRFTELVLDFAKETEANLDATHLTLDAKNTVLVFRNKSDASLWSYEL